MNIDDDRNPRELAETARAARPSNLRVSVLELGEILKISARVIDNYAVTYGEGQTTDPFPVPDGEGLREWAAVRSWLLRRADPLPELDASGNRPWQAMREWLLREAGPARWKDPAEMPKDELKIPLAQRDVLERVLFAERVGGESISRLWIAEVLVLDTKEVTQLLERIATRSGACRPPSHTGLGREVDAGAH